jgi:hypothetical protein
MWFKIVLIIKATFAASRVLLETMDAPANKPGTRLASSVSAPLGTLAIREISNALAIMHELNADLLFVTHLTAP